MVIALPALAAFALAVAALLATFGFEPTKQILSRFFSNVPLIGGWIASNIDTIVGDAIAGLTGWLGILANPLHHWIQALYRPLQSALDGTSNSFVAVYNKLHQIVNTIIPGVVTNLTDLIGREALALTNLIGAEAVALTNLIARVAASLTASIAAEATALTSLIAAEAVNLTDLIGSAVSNLEASIARVVSWAQTEIATTAADLTGLIAAEATALTNLIGSTAVNLERSIAGGLSTLEAWTAAQLVAVYDAVFSTLSRGFADVLGPLWGAIQRPAEQIREDIAAEYPDVAAQLQAIPGTVPLDVVGAIAALGAITIPLTTFVERCGLPMCKNLSGFANDFNILENLLVDGALFAFIAELARDPGAAATEIKDILQPITVEGTDAFKVIAGL